jgi:hypothetical protein
MFGQVNRDAADVAGDPAGELRKYRPLPMTSRVVVTAFDS